MAANRDGFLIFLRALLLGSALLIRTCEGKLPYPFTKHRVRVDNHIQGQSLKVQCMRMGDGDDDLGEHVVPPGGMYQWSFRIDLWVTTQYYCTLSWADWSESFMAYDARDPRFHASSDGDGTCRWSATEEGISLFNAKKGSWGIPRRWKHF